MTNCNSNHDVLAAALADAYTKRAEARARLEQAAQALERGRQCTAMSTTKVTEAQAACVEDINAQARAKAALIATDAGIGKVQPANDDLLLALAKARHVAAVDAQAVAELQNQYDHARSALQAREADVVCAVDAKLNAVRDERATAVIRAHRELLAAGERLRECVVDDLYGTAGRALPPTIQAALDVLPVRNVLHVPVNELRGVHARLDAEWIELRARLIAGDDDIDIAAAPSDAEAA